MNHVSDLLSEFIDGALPEPRRREVQEHLSECADCRKEADELRAISKMVSGMPQAPLPKGFMERLKKRRAAGAQPEPETHWSSAFTMRTAALALCGVMVAMVVVNNWNRRESIPSVALLRQHSADDFGGKNQVQRQAPAAAPEVPQPFPRSEAAARGAEGSGTAALAQAPVTNESLQGFLEKDREKMGIQKVYMKGEKQDDDENRPRRALSKKKYAAEMAQARADMKEMSAAINKIMDDRQGPSVALKNTSTPQLLDKTTQATAPAARAAGQPLSIAEGGKAGSTGDSISEKIDLTEGYVARTPQELALAWQTVLPAATSPNVDFSKEFIAIITPKNPSRAGVVLTSVDTSPRQTVILHYKEAPIASEGKPIDYRIIPKTTLPIIFTKY